jgi:molybdenum cofactor guanylyltransferase
MMSVRCSGVILAGGLSSRFRGRNKAFFELNGRRVIDPIIDVFKSIFDDVLIVTNAPLQYLQYDVTLVTDIFPAKSSLTGIHAGLFYAQNPYIFVAACDTPFILDEMVKMVVSEIRANIDAVIPVTPSGDEPLFAAYAKSSLPVVERHLRQGKFKIKKVFEKMRVVKIPAKRVIETDPELKSFFNINTADDLDRAGGKENTRG